MKQPGLAQLRPVIEALSYAVLVADRSGAIVIANSRATTLFGFAAGELEGITLDALTPARFRGTHSGHVRGWFAGPAARTMGASKVDLFSLRKDGTEFPVDIALSPFKADGKHYAIATVRDLSSVGHYGERFRALVDAVPDALVVCDTSGHLVLVNRATELLFAYGRAELLGQSVGVLFSARSGPGLPSSPLEWFRETGFLVDGTEGLVLWGLRKDGGEFPLEMSVSRLESVDGPLTLATLRDITLRRQSEAAHARLLEETRKLEVAKTAFFANVSHELRTPVSLILGPAEHLQDGQNLSDDQRRELETIRRSARMLLRHVNDLLDVCRIDAGQAVLRYARVDVAAVAAQVAENFEGVARERQVRFHREFPPCLLAELDVDKFQRVLLNLLSNAFKHAPAGSVVRCTMGDTADGRLTLEVADGGPGVPVEDRERIFGRFQQGRSTSGEILGGSGLGLAIAREFIQLHRGHIEVSSAPEGGALFVADLPLRAPEDAEVMPLVTPIRAADAEVIESTQTSSVSIAAPAPVDLPIVLVIEDNHDLNRFVRRVLAGIAHCVAAYDGDDGLRKAIEHRPHLIVTDLMMPIRGGEALIEEVRARRELDRTNIVVLTARADDEVRLRLLEHGAQDYVIKPFSSAELRARVGNLLAIRRVQDILQAELGKSEGAVDDLARELAARKRALELALESSQVARDLAEDVNATKDGFLALVSHELRTPLATLRLQLDRLRTAIPSASVKAVGILSRAERSATRLGSLIETLIFYSSARKGHLRLSIEPVEVRAVAAEVIAELSMEASQKVLTLDLDCPEALPLLPCDRRLLRLALVSLVANAIKFTQHGGVTVRLRRAGGEHQITVSDTGPGIAPEDQARVFLPFETGEKTQKKHAAGLGLGLTLTHEIVLAMGGRLELSSQLGVGTELRVCLPELDAVVEPRSRRGVPGVELSNATPGAPESVLGDGAACRRGPKTWRPTRPDSA